MRTLAIVGVVVILGLGAGSLPASAQSEAKAEDAETRSFHMGFSSWAYAPGEEASKKNGELIEEHGDLVCFQFNGGIPWPEAFEKKAYAPKFEETIQGMLNSVRKGQKIVLEIAALDMMRSGIAGYRGNEESMPRPAPWDGYDFTDAPMATAYSNFCIDVIRRFKPDFVNYSLESTDYMHGNPEKWDDFVAFQKAVYQNIKKVFPDTMLGISIPLKHPDSKEAAMMQKNVPKMHPYVDFLAASAYAFVFFGHENAGDPSNLPKAWFQQFMDMAGDKPVAMGENNWIAEDLVLAPWNIDTKGTPEWQRDYVDLMLTTMNEVNALFVVWWSIADFDKLWETFPEEVKDLGKIWRDTGLLDADLSPRPGMAVWDEWNKRPIKRR